MLLLDTPQVCLNLLKGARGDTCTMETREKIYDLLEDFEEQEETIRKLSQPSVPVIALWTMTCVVSYIYGVTLGLYMCSK